MMDKNNIIYTVMVVIGILSLLNPLYLSPGNPDGMATEIRYELDEVETEDEARQAIFESEATLLCGVGGERPCVLERQIAEQGHIEFSGNLSDRQAYNDDPSQRQNARYKLVELDSGFYIPEANRTGNTTILTHREVSVTNALEHIAIPSTQTSPEVRQAVDTGSIRLFDEQIPAFEQSYPISHEGTIYYVDSVQYSNTVDHELIFWRLILFVTGLALITTAWNKKGT